MATTILLKDIPKKISDEITKEQAAYKLKTDIIISQSSAVIKMLRDYIRCKEQNNFKPEHP